MLAGFGLVGSELDCLPQGGFRFPQLAGVFQNAADVLENHEAMADALQRYIRCYFEIVAPLLHGLADQAAVFKGPAEIDMRVAESFVLLQA